MDRSFLSQDSVIEASRDFVCIRVPTYENEAELAFMKRVYVGRGGDVANTTFAILSPDGKRNLVNPGRGPFMAYRGSSSMASGMQRIAALYASGTNKRWKNDELPVAQNLDLALNIASCDLLPVVAVVANTEQQRAKLSDRILAAAWSEPLAGQFVYAYADSGIPKKLVPGAASSGIYVIEPGPFGMSGTLLAKVSHDSDDAQIRKELTEAAKAMPRKPKSHDGHVRMGIQMGIKWESKLPETDWEAVRAEQRARGRQ